jgi:hypothetical protein
MKLITAIMRPEKQDIDKASAVNRSAQYDVLTVWVAPNASPRLVRSTGSRARSGT